MGVYIKDASGKRIKVAGGGSGAVGPSGQDGKSAYDYAVAGGYTGAEAEFQALMGSGPWVPEAGYIPASNPNLLDNWYFPDPINQRKIQSGVTWSGWTYGIDRWKSYAADATKWVENEGIYLLGITNAILEQSIETSRFGGQRQITFSALIGTTLLSFTQDYESADAPEFFVGGVKYFLAAYAPSDGNKMFRIFRTSVDGEAVPVIAAKVELGDKQTLARKDAAGNWILSDPPPDKATELANCQRYQVQFVSSEQSSAAVMIGVGTANSVGSTCELFLPFPNPITRKGVISFSGDWRLFDGKGNWNDGVKVSSIKSLRISTNGWALSAYPASTITVGIPYFLVGYPPSNSTPDQFSFLFDANL